MNLNRMLLNAITHTFHDQNIYLYRVRYCKQILCNHQSIHTNLSLDCKLLYHYILILYHHHQNIHMNIFLLKNKFISQLYSNYSQILHSHNNIHIHLMLHINHDYYSHLDIFHNKLRSISTQKIIISLIH